MDITAFNFFNKQRPNGNETWRQFWNEDFKSRWLMYTLDYFVKISNFSSSS